MRSILITNGNLPSMIALADWIGKHGSKIEKVYVTSRLPSAKSNIRGFLRLIVTSGLTYSFMKVWLNRLAPLMLHWNGLPASVEELIACLRLSIPVKSVNSVNHPAIRCEIERINPDILVSFSATHRFHRALVRIPRIAAVNVHYGALPRYAGLSPYFWHLYNEETLFGVTLHRIEEELDAGDIITQESCYVGDAQSCLGLLLQMAGRVSPMLNDFFASDLGQIRLCKQDLYKRSYFGHPSKSQVRAFHKKGFRMIDSDARNELVKTVRELVE